MTRTFKTLGVALVAASLTAVTACSPAEFAERIAPDALKQESDVDYRTLFDDITYKGRPLDVYSEEAMEKFAKEIEEASDGELGADWEIDPPECGKVLNSSRQGRGEEKIDIDKYALANSHDFDLTVSAREMGDRDLDDFFDGEYMKKCRSYSIQTPDMGMHITNEEVPFKADADEGRALIARTVSDDGHESKRYEAHAVKNGTEVTVNSSNPSEESIQAANETLVQVLERL